MKSSPIELLVSSYHSAKIWSTQVHSDLPLPTPSYNMPFLSSLMLLTSHIDLVFNVYRPISIKNAERENRSVGKICFRAIVGASKINQINQWVHCYMMGITKLNWLISLPIVGELIVPFKFQFLCILDMKINAFTSMWHTIISLQSLRATKKRMIHKCSCMQNMQVKRSTT